MWTGSLKRLDGDGGGGEGRGGVDLDSSGRQSTTRYPDTTVSGGGHDPDTPVSGSGEPQLKCPLGRRQRWWRLGRVTGC